MHGINWKGQQYSEVGTLSFLFMYACVENDKLIFISQSIYKNRHGVFGFTCGTNFLRRLWRNRYVGPFGE